jgi:hypothetical protein
MTSLKKYETNKNYKKIIMVILLFTIIKAQNFILLVVFTLNFMLETNCLLTIQKHSNQMNIITVPYLKLRNGVYRSSFKSITAT